jgi:hypothetical protein
MNVTESSKKAHIKGEGDKELKKVSFAQFI